MLLKDLCGRSVGEEVTGWALKILKELEGPHGGHAWFAGTERSCRLNSTIIAYRYSMSMITYEVEGKGVRGGKTGNWKLEFRGKEMGDASQVHKTKEGRLNVVHLSSPGWDRN